MSKYLKGFIAGIIITVILTIALGFNTVINEGNDIIFNSISLEVNGEKDDEDAISYEGTMYVPLKKVGERLFKEVSWDEETSTVSIDDYLSISNNRKYEWYIDQKDTGIYSRVNCAPTVSVMAAKWANENFNKTVQDARELYKRHEGAWYESYIRRFLSTYDIPFTYAYKTNIKDIKEHLIQGNIIIICIDTTYLSEVPNDFRKTGKFYPANGGHALIVKGFKEITNCLYFEVYDPNSGGRKYEDGTLKGKDRYYKAVELLYAAQRWQDTYIVVSKYED